MGYGKTIGPLWRGSGITDFTDFTYGAGALKHLRGAFAAPWH
jgi:hypothetical protein